MFKRGIPADRLHKAADLLREQEICEQASSLDELRLALPQDVLESSRIRAWNKLRAELDAVSPSPAQAGAGTRRSLRKRLLTAAAVMVLVFGMTRVVSAEARQRVIDLYKVVLENRIVYRFVKKSGGPAGPLLHLNAEEYFEGFESKLVVDLPKTRDEYYKNDATGDTIMYSCAAVTSASGFGVRGNIRSRESVTVHGFDADLYHSNGKVTENTLIWVDTDRELAFMISTTLSVEDIYDMVELIYR
ncbi:MAG: hypothetical protein IJL27_08130 [Firmicutes bacterium]|nr:hypothetical protein [Bacillota bacterium]